jgi:hypothetical protein
MTVEENPEELKDKEIPPQEDEEDEEEDGPGVAPGAGKFLSFDVDRFSSHRGPR